MPLQTALAESCDTWFYRLGDKFFLRGSQGIQQWAKKLGLGHSTHFDVPGEASGLVPTPAWLRKTYNQPWYEGQTINLSIGQGYLQVTPLQLAVAYSALANGGTVVRPHVANAILRGESVEMLKFPPVRKVKLVDQYAIRDGLYQAAHAPAGTSASLFANFPVPVAGKTGTAEAGTGPERPLVVRVVGAGEEPEGCRRRPRRARRVRGAGRRPRRARHLSVVLQAPRLEALAAVTPRQGLTP